MKEDKFQFINHFLFVILFLEITWNTLQIVASASTRRTRSSGYNTFPFPSHLKWSKLNVISFVLFKRA